MPYGRRGDVKEYKTENEIKRQDFGKYMYRIEINSANWGMKWKKYLISTNCFLCITFFLLFYFFSLCVTFGWKAKCLFIKNEKQCHFACCLDIVFMLRNDCRGNYFLNDFDVDVATKGIVPYQFLAELKSVFFFLFGFFFFGRWDLTQSLRLALHWVKVFHKKKIM